MEQSLQVISWQERLEKWTSRIMAPQQWDDRPGLVSGKSGSGEKLLLLAAAAV